VSELASPAPDTTDDRVRLPVPPAAVAVAPHAATRRDVYLWGLGWTLVRTDFKTRYHGTVGGFVWALLKPLAMFLVLLGVFSFVFRSDPNYRLNLILGLFLYDFFGDATKAGLVSLRMKAYLITKAKFPLWIIVVTSISNAVITLALFLVVALAFLTLSGHPPTLTTALLFVWYQLHYLAIVIGFCLASSVLFLKYRDLNQVWDVVAQAGFFFAPIIYPLGILPERLHFYLYLWPPTPVIMFSRSVLVDGVIPTARAHMLLSLEALVVLGIGALIFRTFAPRAAEAL
jgi:ABC-type polysaccharide/polyol phosphate export permease